ncbi:MAG: CopG family antitoxin [Bdellovibrionota bacterium]
MSKKIPKFKTDEEAAEFIEQDLSEYIEANEFYPMKFEFEKKEKTMTLRVSENLLNAIKEASRKRDMSYQKYVRYVLEEAIKKDAA